MTTPMQLAIADRKRPNQAHKRARAKAKARYQFRARLRNFLELADLQDGSDTFGSAQARGTNGEGSGS